MTESSWRVVEGFDLHRPGAARALRRLIDHVLNDLTDDDEGPEHDDCGAERYTDTANSQQAAS